MSLFGNSWDNLEDNYVPTNTPSCPSKNKVYDPLRPKKPYEEYNAKGELIGYWWNYGDTVNLEFKLSGQITDFEEPGHNISIDDFLLLTKNVMATMNIYNFRHEVIAVKTVETTKTIIEDEEEKTELLPIIFPIDNILSREMVRGTYTIDLVLSCETYPDFTVVITGDDNKNFTLVVK